MNFSSDNKEKPNISKELWETIFNSIEVPMMLLDKDHRIVRINEYMVDIAKIKGNFIGEKCYKIVHGLSNPPEFCPHSVTIEKNIKHTKEIEFQDFWLLVTTSPLYDSDGEIIGSAHIAQDITQLKEREKKIQDELKLKDILIKETHHRVKNNLITISGLLFLQSQHITDPEAKKVLLDSQNRARSMALIHQKIYSQENLQSINLNYYFQQLLDEVLKTYSLDNNVQYTLDVEDIKFDIDTSIILGLILNELISNSLKYAFKENDNGKIDVKLHENNGEFIFKISDNGKTKPADIDMGNNGSFGLTIVNLLSDQIGGKISIEQVRGTTFTITFKHENYTK
jgi:two-component sensor histidine kinase